MDSDRQPGNTVNILHKAVTPSMIIWETKVIWEPKSRNLNLVSTNKNTKMNPDQSDTGAVTAAAAAAAAVDVVIVGGMEITTILLYPIMVKELPWKMQT